MSDLPDYRNPHWEAPSATRGHSAPLRADWPGMRPAVMWAPYRYGVFSWLQSQDQQIAETVAFLRGEILQGVTDGSDAKPGEIGEYVQWERLVPFAVAPPPSVTSVSIGTLPAGDWDCWAYAGLDQWVNNVGFVLDPIPPGFSNGMTGYEGLAAGMESQVCFGVPARALTAQPTPIVFTITANGPTAGNVNFYFAARRRR